MTAIADHYVPTTTYDALLETLLNLPTHFDRRTQLVELLGNIGVWPMLCKDDRDADQTCITTA